MTRPVQRRLLLVTNDFPPRPGGIQSFLYGVVSRLPADEVVVLTSRWRGWAEWDAAQAFTVIRHDTRVMLPTPAVRRHAVEVFRGSGCTDVWFGAAAPLGLLAPALREAGARRIVATTHGHEIGWGAIPGARSLLRRIAGDVDVLTYRGEYTRARLARAIGPRADRLQRLTPGVDTDLFSPEVDGGAKRAKLGWSERPVVVCVSRLMPRKGQDVLVRALPELRRRAGDVGLLLVGGGPSRSHLESLAKEYGVVDSVYITGSVPFEQLPSYYRAGDVFAMPCRERLQGLDVALGDVGQLLDGDGPCNRGTDVAGTAHDCDFAIHSSSLSLHICAIIAVPSSVLFSSFEPGIRRASS